MMDGTQRKNVFSVSAAHERVGQQAVQGAQRMGDDARSEAPAWALFRRFTLSAADQVAREEAARQDLQELEEIMAGDSKKPTTAK